MLRTKRIYELPSADDGLRVLVDRLWPRGVSKEAAALDRWLPEVAPSDELRGWFDHEPDRWDAFCQRYAQELAADKERQDAVTWLGERLQTEGKVTLLYAAKDTEHNNAVALAAYLDQRT